MNGNDNLSQRSQRTRRTAENTSVTSVTSVRDAVDDPGARWMAAMEPVIARVAAGLREMAERRETETRG
jgi:hypothetical protein